MSTLRDALTTHEKFLTNQIATLESERQRVREQLEKLPQEPTRLMDFFREHQTEVEALTKEQEAIQGQNSTKVRSDQATALWKTFKDETGHDFSLEFRSMGIYFRLLLGPHADAHLCVPFNKKSLLLHVPRSTHQTVNNWADAMKSCVHQFDLDTYKALKILMAVFDYRYTKIFHGLAVELGHSESLGEFLKVTYREDS